LRFQASLDRNAGQLRRQTLRRGEFEGVPGAGLEPA
jgi:hypothetical protein